MPKPKTAEPQAAAPSTEGDAPATVQIWADIMQESARFLSQRLKEDIDTQQALLSCKTPQEVVQVQSEFIFKAMQQYTDEAQRMSKIMTSAKGEFGKLAGFNWSRAYDDIPL